MLVFAVRKYEPVKEVIKTITTTALLASVENTLL